MRHLEASDLWIQQLVRSKRIYIKKINGKRNPADLFTKHLTRDEIVFHMTNLGYRLINERGVELGVKNSRGHLSEREEADISIYDDELCQDIALLFGNWKPDIPFTRQGEGGPLSPAGERVSYSSDGGPQSSVGKSPVYQISALSVGKSRAVHFDEIIHYEPNT